MERLKDQTGRQQVLQGLRRFHGLASLFKSVCYDGAELMMLVMNAAPALLLIHYSFS